MANFTVVNTTAITAGTSQRACTTSYQTQILANNSTGVTGNSFGTGRLVRGKLFDILVGTAGTPADNYMEWDIIRATGGTTTSTAGSTGAITQVSSLFSNDPGDSYGCVNAVTINASLETFATVGAEIFYVGVNQRASYRWVAAPGSELVWPANTSATVSNGLAGRVRSGGYTGICTMQWIFQEQ